LCEPNFLAYLKKIIAPVPLSPLGNIAVQEEGESTPSTRRSCPSLNDDPSLCATLYTFGGVGELYQRRSHFMESFRCVDHHPSGLGKSESGW